MTKKTTPTFEREMQNKKFKKKFEKEYQEFLLSELIIALMEKDNKSVRQLAEEVNMSPTVIQKLRSRKQNDIKMKNFINIVKACGYHLILVKGKEKILIS